MRGGPFWAAAKLVIVEIRFSKYGVSQSLTNSVGLEKAAAVTSAAVVGGCREVTRTLPMVVDVADSAS